MLRDNVGRSLASRMEAHFDWLVIFFFPMQIIFPMFYDKAYFLSSKAKQSYSLARQTLALEAKVFFDRLRNRENSSSD
jgi:non-homologous end joining protein Ku